TIDKAATQTTVTVADATYDSTPHGGTAVVTGPAGLNQSLTVTYTGITGTVYGLSTTAPTNAGSYNAAATYAESANYLGSTDNKNFTINKATPTVSVSWTSYTYDGTPHAATGFAYGVGGVSGVLSPVVTFTYAGTGSTTYGPTATAPTNAGTYQVTASFAGNANYTNASNTASITISRATPVFSNLVGSTITFGDTPTVLLGKASKGALIPTGNVAITLNGVTQQAAIQGGGTFSSSFATGALTVVPGSPYTITYNYQGDNNFYGVGPDTSKALTVATKSTSTILAVTPSSVQYSDQVTLSATVSPATLGGQTLT